MATCKYETYSTGMMTTLGDLLELSRQAAWLGIVVLLLALLALGCSGSRLETVTVPPQPSSVQPPSVTDTVTLDGIAPIPPPGTPTAPVEVVEYDTAVGGSGPVNAISLSAEDIEVVKPDGEVLTFETPAFGETLTLNMRSDTTEAVVSGEPQEETVKAETPKRKEGWWGLKTEFAVVGAIILGTVAGAIGLKIFTGSILPI